ncbi:putative porin, partial [Bacteroidota bacterium]
NFKWENSYLRRIEEWDAGFAIRSAKYKFRAKVQYGQISNHIYLDTTAYVNQHQGQINILSAELYKRLKLGPVNSITRFVYQESTNDSILNLPKYNLYQSLYYERLSHFNATGGKLLWQVGIDYRYTSSYMADGYMPSSGLFYRQYDHQQENYHCFDVFINVTIKRARFYVKYNYLNSAINEHYYFTGPYYPSPEPILKFGLAWTFYD